MVSPLVLVTMVGGICFTFGYLDPLGKFSSISVSRRELEESKPSVASLPSPYSPRVARAERASSPICRLWGLRSVVSIYFESWIL